MNERLKNTNSVVTSKTALAVDAAPNECISASGRVVDHVKLLSAASNSHVDDVVVTVFSSVIADDIIVPVVTRWRSGNLFAEPETGSIV